MSACRRLYPNNDFFYLPDEASSHTSVVAQQHLHKELGRRFVDKFSWPPSSPNCSPLDYYFWNAVSKRSTVDDALHLKILKSLKKKIKQVWRGSSEIQVL